MTDIGTDFITFLKAYYPEDVAKLSGENVDDRMLNAIIAKHQTKFDIWKKVPERIRDEYLGRVPDDILQAAKTDDNLTLNECREIENNRAIPSTTDILSSDTAGKIVFGAAAIEAIHERAKEIIQKGYSDKAATRLATTSAMRTEIINLMKNGLISQEEAKKAYRKTREDDITTIKSDWATNQPEKLLVRIAKQLDRNKIDSETAIPQMFELMKKVKEMGREDQLNELLNSPNSRYDKWKDDTRLLFDNIRKSNQPSRIIQIQSIKHEWMEHQPEKMLIHVAKELDRGKISKEEASVKMNELMLKVKTMGRETELKELLNSPNSRYDKWNKENRAAFNEIMYKNEIGDAAKSYNKIRENLTTKEEQKPTPVVAPVQPVQNISSSISKQMIEGR